MSTNFIDLKSLPSHIPSMCIPRVFTNITEQRIRKVFDELNIGTIYRIDIVNKNTEKGENFNRVFIHFSKWNTTANAEKARTMLLNGKEIKIIYDEPWFWKISAYHESKPKNNKQPYEKKSSVSIVFEEDTKNNQINNNKNKYSQNNKYTQNNNNNNDRPRKKLISFSKRMNNNNNNILEDGEIPVNSSS